MAGAVEPARRALTDHSVSGPTYDAPVGLSSDPPMIDTLTPPPRPGADKRAALLAVALRLIARAGLRRGATPWGYAAGLRPPYGSSSIVSTTFPRARPVSR